MIVARMFAGLILMVLGMTSCGCVAHHHGIPHPRDYGTIGTTPHCVSSSLIRDPLFFGHRPTRWRQWPSDYISWRYSTSHCPLPTDEELLAAPEPGTAGEEESSGEELPEAADPFRSDANIDRLPDAPADAGLGTPSDRAIDEPATPPDPLDPFAPLDADDVMDESDESDEPDESDE